MFADDQVELTLQMFEAGWRDELDALLADVLARWDGLARSRGAVDLMDAAERGLVEMGEVQPPVEAAKARALDAMEASGQLGAWRVDGRRDQPSPAERREFAGMVMSRFLRRRLEEVRGDRVVALRAAEAPAGVEFHHRESRMLNVA